MRPSRIVNKTSSNAFLSIAYCENIIKITFFSWKCAGHDNNIFCRNMFSWVTRVFCKLCQHNHKWQIFSLIQGFLHDSVNIKIGNITQQSCVTPIKAVVAKCNSFSISLNDWEVHNEFIICIGPDTGHAGGISISTQPPLGTLRVGTRGPGSIKAPAPRDDKLILYAELLILRTACSTLYIVAIAVCSSMLPVRARAWTCENHINDVLSQFLCASHNKLADLVLFSSSRVKQV